MIEDAKTNESVTVMPPISYVFQVLHGLKIIKKFKSCILFVMFTFNFLLTLSFTQ